MLFSTEEGEGQNLKFDRRMRFEVNFVTAFKLGLKTTMRTLPDGWWNEKLSCRRQTARGAFSVILLNLVVIGVKRYLRY